MAGSESNQDQAATGNSQTFPRSARLTRPRDFQAVLGRPSIRIQFGPLRLLAKPNTMPTARLGLIVAKRRVSRAVQRNRLKRVIRERFRQRLAELPPVDLVVQIMQSQDNQDLARNVDAALTRLQREFQHREAARDTETGMTQAAPDTAR